MNKRELINYFKSEVSRNYRRFCKNWGKLATHKYFEGLLDGLNKCVEFNHLEYIEAWDFLIDFSFEIKKHYSDETD